MKKVLAALKMVLLIYVISSSARRLKGDALAKELLVNAEHKRKEFVPNVLCSVHVENAIAKTPLGRHQ